VSAEAGDQLLAGLLTTSAGLRADPAVFVHLGVPVALIGAGPAGSRAGLQHGAGEVGVVAGVPGQHPAGGVADVCAVQVGADALDQVGDPGLAQARVGARGTALGAVEAFIDTPGQCCAVDVAEVGRLGAQHLLNMAHRYLPSSILACWRYPLRQTPTSALVRSPTSIPTTRRKSSVQVTIHTASIRTHNEIRDNDLRSSNVLEIDKYPTITFKTTSVDPSARTATRSPVT
jgi:YceI-like domain